MSALSVDIHIHTPGYPYTFARYPYSRCSGEQLLLTRGAESKSESESESESEPESPRVVVTSQESESESGSVRSPQWKSESVRIGTAPSRLRNTGRGPESETESAGVMATSQESES